MAKFFQKKVKEESPVRTLTPEEQARADAMMVPREELILAMRQMGVSEEKIKEACPDPLPQPEQDKMLYELRVMYSAQKYTEVISTFGDKVSSGLLSGDVLNETGFAVGVSAILTGDKEYISRYAGHTISYLLQRIKQMDPAKTLGTIRALMQMGENHLPGCMKQSARKLYPALRTFLPDDDEFVLEVKSYM
jgi:DNA-binding transcriptional MerR regulator